MPGWVLCALGIWGGSLGGVAPDSAPAAAVDWGRVVGPLRQEVTKGLPGLAPTYVRAKDGSVLAVKPSDDSYKWPSGGYVSTAEDLVALGNCYMRPGFLSEASLKAAETSQTTVSGKPTGYSLGWFVSHEADGTVVLSHEGEAVGGEALLVVIPAKKAVFAAAWDVSQAEVTPLLDRVGRELADGRN